MYVSKDNLTNPATSWRILQFHNAHGQYYELLLGLYYSLQGDEQQTDQLLEVQDLESLSVVDEELVHQSREGVQNNVIDDITTIQAIEEWTRFRDTLAMNMFANYQRSWYGIVSDILGQSGFDWDGTKHMIIVENENTWNEYCTKLKFSSYRLLQETPSELVEHRSGLSVEKLEEVARLTRNFASSESKAVNLGQLLNVCTTDALAKIVIGR
ncbi:hypothetical protein JHK85_056417 [Glycine max]|nr:hypothetical protein JHK85_056417 [Glycine max]